jgi:DNA-binding PadR family transcriptional regulator
MSIQLAILGLLNANPLTGYDLKKVFADSDIFYWSGSNNQIYHALVELHQDKLVTQTIEHQDNGPSRKVYHITDAGRKALQEWVLSPPDLPQLRHPFLIQLVWGDQVDAAELDDLLARYEDEVRVRLLMLREQTQRRTLTPTSTPRGVFLWERITAYWIAFHKQELTWIRRLRADLNSKGME